MTTREQVQRPIRNLLQYLPRLPLNGEKKIDFPGADAELLVAIADDAETTVGVFHYGIGAIGHLLSQSAVAIEDGTMGADCVESLGYLLAELSEFSAGIMILAAQRRRETQDCRPQLSKRPAL